MVMAIVNPHTSTTPRAEADAWRTPPDTFAYLNGRYGPFDLDAAATEANRLCPLWLGPGSAVAPDALACPWGVYPALTGHYDPTRVFVNPPYSRGMVARFVKKAYQEAWCDRAHTCLLLPATTEVQWWHDWVWDAGRGGFRRGVLVEFIQKRVRFCRPDGTVAGSPGIGSVAVYMGRVR